MKKILPLLALLFWGAASPTLPTPNRTGRDYAVFFYVTQFQPGWQALPETEKEAIALKNELETNFGFACELVANPTKQQMRDKLREYNTRLGADDQVLLFFSMHGHYDEASDRGYLIAKDGKAQDDYRDTWLSYDDLRTDLALCRARHILLALDACHSGSFGIRNKSKPGSAAYDEASDCAAKIAKTMQYTGRQFCSSGNKTAKTPARSQFATRFLEALRKGGSDGLLFFDDLEYWLGKAENPQPESGTFGGHAPGGDFVFVKKGGCAAGGPENTTADDRAFQKAKNRGELRDFEDYLDVFSEGRHKAEAELAISFLKKDDPLGLVLGRV